MIPAMKARPDESHPKRPEPEVLPFPAQRPIEPAGAKPAGLSDEVTGRDFMNALRYHSILFLVFGTLAAVCCGAAAWYLVPAKYTTFSMVRIYQNPNQVLGRSGGDTGYTQFGTYVKTQATIINSPTVINVALADPAIAQLEMIRKQEDPVHWLGQEIKAETSETNEIVKITLTGEDPQEVTQVVNAVTDAYMKWAETENQWRTQRINKLEVERQTLEKVVKDKWNKLYGDFGDILGTSIQGPKSRKRMAEYTRLQQVKLQTEFALEQTKRQMSVAEARLRALDTSDLPLPDLSAFIENDPQVREKTVAIERIQKALDVHERTARDPSREPGPSLRAKLAKETAAQDALRQVVRKRIIDENKGQKRFEMTVQAERIRADVAAFETDVQANAKKLEAYKDLDLDETEKPFADMQMAQEELVQQRVTLAEIERELNRAKVELSSPNRVDLSQKAQVPQKREMKKQIAFSGFSSLLGLGLVGGLISAVEVRRKRVYSAKDPVFRQCLPLLGCIPEYAGEGRSGDPTGRAFHGAVDGVKTILCRRMDQRGLQVVLVTSAQPDEGKSILAWNLALSLARTDRKTLYVDANLVHPTLHRHFDLAESPGLSELLRNEKTLPEALQRTSLDNLWCLTSGACDELARQALDKDRLRKLLERARQEFDYVVIDTCSLQESVDPMYLAQRADATLLSLRNYRSRVNAVEAACQRLGMVGTPLLGGVLADSSLRGADV
jgi:capsular exopolysaccharide synthesis family protein